LPPATARPEKEPIVATGTTKTAVVIADVVAWTTPREGKPDDPQYHRADKGNTIELPTSEFDRLAGYGAVAEPGVAAQAAAERTELEAGTYTDEELAALDASELAAYVGQHPDDALRVFQLEQARKRGPRKTVIEATGYELDDQGQPAPVVEAATITPGDGGTPAVTS
jgi:hypothetical protein